MFSEKINKGDCITIFNIEGGSIAKGISDWNAEDIDEALKTNNSEKIISDIKNFKIDSILTEQTMIGIFFREVLGDFFEKLIQNIKFRIKLSGKSKLNLFSISKAEINTLYATHQYSLFQRYFYDHLWKNDGKKSVDFFPKGHNLL